MKFKLDENMPRSALALPRSAGHDALSVHDQGLAGEPDKRLAEVCRAEGRCLVTVDLGFADLQSFPLARDWSAVVRRSRGAGRGSVRILIQRLLEAVERESPDGALWIVSETEIRIRKSSE